MIRVFTLLFVLVGMGCNWAPFGDDDDDHDADGDADADADADADGDADVDPPVICADRVCILGGGIRTLGGPELTGGGLSIRGDGLEGLGRSCAGSVCIEGGLEP